jgi:hypothetical protein
VLHQLDIGRLEWEDVAATEQGGDGVGVRL